MAKEMFNIHSGFKLNGASFNTPELIIYCKRNLTESTGVFNFILEWLNSSKVIEVQSSGSTGFPKTFLTKKSAMINSAKNTGKFFKLKEGDRALLCLPVKFIAGQMMVVRALVLGFDLLIQKPNNSPLKNLSKTFDFVAMTPYQLSNSINYLEKARCLITGGSPVDDKLKKKIINKSSGIFETYGMSETLTHVAVKNLSAGEKAFTALPGISFKLKNGCLEISAPYLSNSSFITNDQVELISKTKFFWIGRSDFIINSGGIKIVPEKIEKKLAPYYSETFAVCGLPDQKLGEKIVLAFEDKIPLNAKIPFKVLDRFEKPKKLFCIKKFKRNNGKIDRISLRNNILKLIHGRN